MLLNNGRPSHGSVCGELRIRIMEHRDIENARVLHNEDSVLSQMTDNHLVSKAEQEIWFEAMSKSKKSRRLVIEEVASGDFVGVFRLDQVDLQNRNAMVGLDIVESKRGQGFAKIVYRWVFKYLFDDIGLHRLSLVTLETNLIAINLYKSLGFALEGRQKQAIWRNGEFVDLLCFSLIR